MAAELARLRAREDELLEHNTKLVEERREWKHHADFFRGRCVELVGINEVLRKLQEDPVERSALGELLLCSSLQVEHVVVGPWRHAPRPKNLEVAWRDFPNARGDVARVWPRGTADDHQLDGIRKNDPPSVAAPFMWAVWSPGDLAKPVAGGVCESIAVGRNMADMELVRRGCSFAEGPL